MASERYSLEAARQVVARIIENVQHLEAMPQLGHFGRVAGTREISISPYIVIYRIVDEGRVISTEAVIHGARNF